MSINISTTSESKTLGGKITTSIFLSIFFFMGLLFLVFMGKEFYENCSPYFWDETPCAIVSSKIVEPNDSSSEPKFEVQYNYRYKNRLYTGDKFSVKGAASENARRWKQKYPPGTKTKCYVNPSSPGEAVIHREVEWFILPFALIPLIFVAVGAGGIYAVWKKSAPEKTGSAAVTAAKKIEIKHPRAFLALFFSLFFFAGAGFGWMMVGKPLLKIHESENWPKVPCEIVSSRVKVSHGDDSTTYRADITFRYKFEKMEYIGGSYDFMTGSDSDYSSKSQVVGRYPPGKKTYCYVNPADPVEAVISREFNAPWWMPILPGVFMLVGAGGIIGTLIKKKKKHVYAPGVEETVPNFVAPDSETVLTMESSPLKNFIAAVFVALFWNGIVSIFVGIAVRSWIRGDVEWFLSFFIIPFVLIGLVMIGAVIYCFIALFNSRVVVTISNPCPQPGEKLTLGWKILNATSVNKLEIYLKGEESATYQGKGDDNSKTEKSTFELLKLLDTENRDAIHIGRTQFTVPSGTMHSFDGKDNKIQWRIVLRGHIKRRPDINCEYPITLMPFDQESLHKLLRSAENGKENG